MKLLRKRKVSPRKVPTKKTLKVIVFGSTRRFIVVFGGMAVMVVTTVCGLWIGGQFRCCGGRMDYSALFYGGVIGAVVGGLLWGLLVYVCRDKKPAELPPGPPTS
jgi:hypothetical protein